MGGTPPADMMPLKICQGDCDKDDGKEIKRICGRIKATIVDPYVITRFALASIQTVLLV